MSSKLFTSPVFQSVSLFPCLFLVHGVPSACVSVCRANNHRTEAVEEATAEVAMRRDTPDHTHRRASVQDGVELVGEHGREEADLNVDSTPRPPPLGVPIVTTSRGEPTMSCISDVVFEEQSKATGVSELTGGSR